MSASIVTAQTCHFAQRSIHEIVIFSIEINNLFNYKPSGIETENLKMAINEFMDKALSLCH